MVGRKPIASPLVVATVERMYDEWRQTPGPRAIAKIMGLSTNTVSRIGRRKYRLKNHAARP